MPLIKRLWPIAAALLITAGVALWWMSGRKDGPRYVTAQVDRGSVVRSVTATGTVNPVTIVQVGTYDSGPIIAIYADFNSPVKAGQLIAKIDPRPFQVKVARSGGCAWLMRKAQLGKDQADLAYKNLTFERDHKCSTEKVISQDTLDNAPQRFQQDVAQVALDRAISISSKPTWKKPRSTWTTPISFRRSTAPWSRATSMLDRRLPRAFRLRRCF